MSICITKIHGSFNQKSLNTSIKQYYFYNALRMTATYAVIHFEKPIGETISSVFGGYILGIIALYSCNIWGDIFIHGVTAFVMEIFAFLKQ